MSNTGHKGTAAQAEEVAQGSNSYSCCALLQTPAAPCPHSHASFPASFTAFKQFGCLQLHCRHEQGGPAMLCSCHPPTCSLL